MTRLMVGRPRKYETVEELESVIDEYFASCMVNETHLTVTGLALALDLSRKSLNNYQGREEFLPTIKRAKAVVENYIENVLMDGKATAGAIFNLKNNYEWLDEKTSNQNIQGSIGVSGTRVIFADSDGNNA